VHDNNKVKAILENKQGTTHVVLAGSIHGANQQCQLVAEEEIKHRENAPDSLFGHLAQEG